ncbi:MULTISPECIES: HNH endonuclease [Rhodococcus]|uniref:HNH endonuclease n=1 Tax=Rhodococcus TaxID=1827 RepID=UPI003092233A|nr:hypothetical protein RDE2_07640 [Rhodococcus sp. RDE2]
MAWRSGGRSRTGTAAHKRWRTAVLTRDGYRCRRCGRHDPTGRTLRADHKVNTARGGDDSLDNGQTLCDDCHDVKTQVEAADGRARRRRPLYDEPHPGLLR